MKKFAVIVPAVLVVLLAVALIAPSFVDWNQYKQPAIDQIKQMTGHEVSIDGNVSMAVLPAPHLYVETLRVGAPEGSQVADLATIKRLDVSIAVLPLLTGQVELSSVTLVEPVIALEVFSDGRQNWMTPELEAMMNAPKAADGAAPPVALQDVEIENGSFTYIQGGKTAAAVTEIAARLNADSLSGPFMAEGRMKTAGQVINFEGKTASLPADGSAMPVNLQFGLGDGLLDLTFAGVANMGDAPGVQGETSVKISSVAALAKSFGGSDAGLQDAPFLAKGLLTADNKAVDFKDASFQLGGAKFTGGVQAGLAPINITANLEGQDTINLSEIMGSSAAQASGTSAPQDLAGVLDALLPPELTVPSGFSAKINLTAPALVMNGEIFSTISASAEKAGQSFKAGFAAQKIPGGGQMDAIANLAYAQKKQKDGADVLTAPTLTIGFDVTAQNAAKFVQALSKGSESILPSGLQTASLKGGLEVTPKSAVLKQSAVRLNDSVFNVSGAFAAPKEGRAALAVDLSADTLDVDKLMGVSAAPSSAPADIAGTLKSFSLPMDVDFDVGVQNLLLQGKSIKGVRAQGQYRSNEIRFKNLSAQNYMGGAFKVEGGIADLKNLAGLNLTAQAQADDMRALANNFGVDASALPENVKNGRVSASVKGSLAEADVSADISALGGTATAKGQMKDLLGTMALGDITLQVRHQNMNEALRIFAPAAPRYQSWNKPLELSAGLDQGSGRMGLKNIKGNLAGANVEGNISMNTEGKPSLKGALTFGQLNMTGGPAAAAPTSGERWSKAPMDNSWMTAFNADLDIKASGLQYEGWNLKNATLKFALQDGRLNIADMGSDLFGGRMALSGAASTTADGKGPLSVDMKTTMNKVSLEEVMTAFTGNVVLRGQGSLDNLEATFKGSGTSMNQLVNNLSGAGTMSGRNIVLEGFDLERFARAMSEESKPGDTALGLWKTSIKGGSTAFDTLSGAYTMTGGVANISKLDLDGPKSSITTKGNVSLPAWRVDMAHTIALKNNPDVPPFTVQISGPLDNPASTFGQGLIEDYFKRKLNRKLEKLITDKLGGKLGFPAPAAGDSNAPQQPLQAEDAIKGVLKGLLR